MADQAWQLGHQEPSSAARHHCERVIGQLLTQMLHQLFHRPKLAPKQPTAEGITGIFGASLGR